LKKNTILINILINLLKYINYNNLRKTFRYLIGLVVFIFFELKKIRILYRYFFGFFFKEINIVNFILKNFGYEKKAIFKDQNLNKFLEKNKKYIKNKKKKSKKKIVVECLINHPIYTIGAGVLSSSLSNIVGAETCGLIRKGDLKSKAILESFGIKKIILLKNFNLLTRLKFFYKSIFLTNGLLNIREILNLKINNIEIGKSAYEHFIRFVGYTPKNINWKLIYFFSEALIYLNKSNEIIKKNLPEYWVQSELQFVPHRIFSQNALKQKIKLVSMSNIKKVGIKVYKNFSEKNINRHKISKKLFDIIYKKHKNKILNSSNNLFFNKQKIQLGKEIHQKILKNKKIETIIFNTKNNFKSSYGWKNNYPIVLILSHQMTDGSFGNSWNLFENDNEWLKQTIEFLKNKKVNVIIKKHPSEKFYNSKINTEKIFFECTSNNINNIKLFIKEHDLKNISKFIDVSITSHGSAGYQYPILSIPTIICGETYYSNLGFTIEPKTIKEYIKLLNNLDKIKKLKLNSINKAKVFLYIFYELSRVEMPLIYYSNIRMDYDKNKFWKETLKVQNRYNKEKNKFNKFFEHQIRNLNSNIIRYDLINDLKNISF
jgi:hypothetical protein